MAGALASGLLVAACARPPLLDAAEAGHARSAVLYGDDDRGEVFERDDALAAIARNDVFAVLPRAAVDVEDAPAVSVRAAPLQVLEDLCDDERFAEQPAAASCTAVLVDDDLVLTAGHCITDETCPRTRLVRGFLYDAPEELALTSLDDVFACRRVAFRRGADDVDDLRDFAFVQLDRGAGVPRVRGDVVSAAEELDVDAIATSGGVPLKVARGEAQRLDERTWRANVDVARGASGAPLVATTTGSLVGMLVRGNDDWIETAEGCRRSVRLDPAAPREEALDTRALIDALCASGWPSSRLCGSVGTCADDVCVSEETLCEADCPSSSCNDGACARDEWTSCASDCGDGRAPGLPRGWFCSDDWFADGETCDCACGDVDPDCADASSASCDRIGPLGRRPRGTGCASIPAEPSLACCALLVAALCRRRRHGA